jgi:BirA family biotin operon repressor/biotin-[acetyl-CoA-carboxylase] ligase
LAVGVGAARVLKTFQAPVSLKWPNDIVVLDRDIEIRKLGGVLIEVQEISRKQCILVGLGVNISEPPIEVRHNATSLQDLGINFASQGELLAALAEELKEQHRKFCGVGFSGVQSEWMKYSCFVKNRTRLIIDICSESVSGVYAGVSEVGALLLNVNGEERAVHSGHIVEVNL